MHTVEYLPTYSPNDIVRHIRESGKDDGSSYQEQEKPEHTTDHELYPPCNLEQKKFSSLARAKLVASDSNGVSFDPKLHVLNIKGLTGNVRVVTLFPKESPSTGLCYHIMAAKISLGASFENKPSRRVLTELRKNTRTQSEKKSGRKRSCPKDDINGEHESNT